MRREILDHLRQDPGCRATTMVDYYALPATGPKAWPNRKEAAALPFPHKAAAIESAMLADVCNDHGDNFNPARFIPFVVMHEFEGLLFSDPKAFARGINRPDLLPEFQAIRNEFKSPEEINDSSITAPSKRIERLHPNFTKPLLGELAALEIGLPTIRRECPLFHDWLIRLGA